MMFDVAEDVTRRDAAQDATALSASGSPTEHVYAWALDDGDAVDYPDHHGWRPTLFRAAAVLGLLLAGAAAIVALWWQHAAQGPESGGWSSSVASSDAVDMPTLGAEPAPVTTVTVTEPVPDAQTEAPKPRPTSVAPPPQLPRNPSADQTYIALVSQIPGVLVTDPAAFLAGGPKACSDLVSRGRAATEADVQANDPGFTLWQAAALVNAAVVAYCPQNAGVS